MAQFSIFYPICWIVGLMLLSNSEFECMLSSNKFGVTSSAFRGDLWQKMAVCHYSALGPGVVSPGVGNVLGVYCTLNLGIRALDILVVYNTPAVRLWTPLSLHGDWPPPQHLYEGIPS